MRGHECKERWIPSTFTEHLLQQPLNGSEVKAVEILFWGCLTTSPFGAHRAEPIIITDTHSGGYVGFLGCFLLNQKFSNNFKARVQLQLKPLKSRRGCVLRASSWLIKSQHNKPGNIQLFLGCHKRFTVGPCYSAEVSEAGCLVCTRLPPPPPPAPT